MSTAAKVICEGDARCCWERKWERHDGDVACRLCDVHSLKLGVGGWRGCGGSYPRAHFAWHNSTV